MTIKIFVGPDLDEIASPALIRRAVLIDVTLCIIGKLDSGAARAMD
jgi:hypothetical protein